MKSRILILGMILMSMSCQKSKLIDINNRIHDKYIHISPVMTGGTSNMGLEASTRVTPGITPPGVIAPPGVGGPTPSLEPPPPVSPVDPPPSPIPPTPSPVLPGGGGGGTIGPPPPPPEPSPYIPPVPHHGDDNNPIPEPPPPTPGGAEEHTSTGSTNTPSPVENYLFAYLSDYDNMLSQDPPSRSLVPCNATTWNQNFNRIVISAKFHDDNEVYFKFLNLLRRQAFSSQNDIDNNPGSGLDQIDPKRGGSMNNAYKPANITNKSDVWTEYGGLNTDGTGGENNTGYPSYVQGTGDITYDEGSGTGANGSQTGIDGPIRGRSYQWVNGRSIDFYSYAFNPAIVTYPSDLYTIPGYDQNDVPYTNMPPARPHFADNYFCYGPFKDNFKLTNSGAEIDNVVPASYTVRQWDLVVACSLNKNSENATTGNLPLFFKHALSAIDVRAVSSDKRYSIVVKGVKLVGLNNKGTFTFPTSDTQSGATLSPSCWSTSRVTSDTQTYPLAYYTDAAYFPRTINDYGVNYYTKSYAFASDLSHIPYIYPYKEDRNAQSELGPNSVRYWRGATNYYGDHSPKLDFYVPYSTTPYSSSTAKQDEANLRPNFESWNIPDNNYNGSPSKYGYFTVSGLTPTSLIPGCNIFYVLPQTINSATVSGNKLQNNGAYLGILLKVYKLNPSSPNENLEQLKADVTNEKQILPKPTGGSRDDANYVYACIPLTTGGNKLTLEPGKKYVFTLNFFGSDSYGGIGYYEPQNLNDDNEHFLVGGSIPDKYFNNGIGGKLNPGTNNQPNILVTPTSSQEGEVMLPEVVKFSGATENFFTYTSGNTQYININL